MPFIPHRGSFCFILLFLISISFLVSWLAVQGGTLSYRAIGVDMVLTRPALDRLTFSYFLSLGFMRRFQYAELGCLCTWELGSSRSVGHSFLM